jgi:hypothetical protein
VATKKGKEREKEKGKIEIQRMSGATALLGI